MKPSFLPMQQWLVALAQPLTEIIGRTSYDLFPQRLAAKRMEHLQEVVRTGKADPF